VRRVKRAWVWLVYGERHLSWRKGTSSFFSVVIARRGPALRRRRPGTIPAGWSNLGWISEEGVTRDH
jgi:hypothetical protein